MLGRYNNPALMRQCLAGIVILAVATLTCDSAHAASAVTYRAERHVLETQLYQIEDRQPSVVTAVDLVETALSRKAETLEQDETDLNSRYTTLTWSGPKRFVVKERRLYRTKTPGLLEAFGQFGKVTGGYEPDKLTFITFSVEVTCELTGDSYRIVDIRPGQFED
jgi:hypothetical protein